MTYMKRLDNLTELLGSSEGMTSDEIRQELEEEGVDVDAFLKRAMKHIDELKSRR